MEEFEGPDCKFEFYASISPGVGFHQYCCEEDFFWELMQTEPDADEEPADWGGQPIVLGTIRQPPNWKYKALFGAAPKCGPSRVGVIGNSTCQGKSFNEMGVQGGLCFPEPLEVIITEFTSTLSVFLLGQSRTWILKVLGGKRGRRERKGGPDM